MSQELLATTRSLKSRTLFADVMVQARHGGTCYSRSIRSNKPYDLERNDANGAKTRPSTVSSKDTKKTQKKSCRVNSHLYFRILNNEIMFKGKVCGVIIVEYYQSFQIGLGFNVI